VRFAYFCVAIDFLPEAAAYGKGAMAWQNVKAAVDNGAGLPIGMSTLKAQMKAFASEFTKYENQTERSGTDQEVVEIMELYREYKEKNDARKVSPYFVFLAPRVASFISFS